MAASNEVPEVETEVLIMDLKEVYDKRTKKTKNGLEYRLEDSEVTIVLRASEQIRHIRVYVQRCAEAAIKTHDTIGELFIHEIENGVRAYLDPCKPHSSQTCSGYITQFRQYFIMNLK